MKKILLVLLLAQVLLLALVLRLVNLNQSLWLDEAAQAIESSGSFAGLFQIYADFMPPLFHILLYFWVKISTSESWMRLLSVGFGVGTVFYTYKLAKEFFNHNIALLSAFLLAISPYHIYYSQELRPYGLATLLGVMSTFYLIRLNFYRYFFASALFIYSIYTAPFLLLAHLVYIFAKARDRLRQWLVAVLVVGLSFVPWLPVFWRQLVGGRGLLSNLPGWSTAVSTPPLKAVPLMLAKFILGRITIDNKLLYGVCFLGLVALVTYLFWQSWRRRKNSTIALSLMVAIPIATLFLVSFVLPVIAPQRLLFTLPLFLIILASGIISTRPRWRFLALTVVVIANIFGLTLYYTNPRFQREQWRQATAFVEEMVGEKTAVLFAFPEPFAPFQWYRSDEHLGKGIVEDFVVNDSDLAEASKQIAGKDEVFYFQYLTELTDPSKKIPSFLVNHGFTLSATYDFTGVGFIYHYRK